MQKELKRTANPPSPAPAGWALEERTSMKTAKLIKKLPGFRGTAALYELSEPLQGHKLVIVSAVVAMFSGPETYIFPATCEGEIGDWGELDGSYRGGMDHQEALEGAGYSIVPNTKVSDSREFWSGSGCPIPGGSRDLPPETLMQNDRTQARRPLSNDKQKGDPGVA